MMKRIWQTFANAARLAVAFVGRYDEPERARPPIKIVKRRAQPMLSDTPPPRYGLSPDGVWRQTKTGRTNTQRANILFVGDLMCAERQQKAARTGKTYDFNKSFQFTKPIFESADLAVGNLETSLAQDRPFRHEIRGRRHLGDKPYHNSPVAFLDALRYTGFDAVITANNHILDAGYPGAMQTLGHIERYGFMHTGTFKDGGERRYIIVDVNGIRISIHAYALWYNKKEEKYLKPEAWGTLLNFHDPEKAAAEFAAARKDGAEFIFAYMHAGREFEHTESPTQQKVSQELADAGADYILGSHPHVLQRYDTIETIDNRSVPVIYSLGNFTTNMTALNRRQTIILGVTLARDKGGRVVIADESYIPAFIECAFNGNPYAILPLVAPYNACFDYPGGKYHIDAIAKIIGNKLKVRQ